LNDPSVTKKRIERSTMNNALWISRLFPRKLLIPCENIVDITYKSGIAMAEPVRIFGRVTESSLSFALIKKISEIITNNTSTVVFTTANVAIAEGIKISGNKKIPMLMINADNEYFDFTSSFIL
jgi:hypothetical protein